MDGEFGPYVVSGGASFLAIILSIPVLGIPQLFPVFATRTLGIGMITGAAGFALTEQYFSR